MQHQSIFFDLNHNEALRETIASLRFEGVFADEILGPVNGEAKPGLKRCYCRAKVVVPVFEAHFDAAGVDSVVAHWLGAPASLASLA